MIDLATCSWKRRKMKYIELFGAVSSWGLRLIERYLHRLLLGYVFDASGERFETDASR